jgi:hypothetical protein
MRGERIVTYLVTYLVAYHLVAYLVTYLVTYMHLVNRTTEHARASQMPIYAAALRLASVISIFLSG